MSDWTGGYVADIGYTHGYYAELNPLRIKLAFLQAGYAFPDNGTACELGFGQGVSINIHGAATTTKWFGTDFNPAQAGFAQDLAQSCGNGAHLFDEAFEAFCRRDDLPEFDYIGLHGIWSWISDQNRAVIVDFLRRKLKVGGVLYISYNTQPGWAAMAPMRDLLTEHAEKMSPPGAGILPRVDAALQFAQRMLDTDAIYAKANPIVKGRLAHIMGQDRSYLAHEYFNRDWLPMPFSRMASWLDDAKLSYACSSHYPDLLDVINLTDDQKTLLAEIPDRMFRETVRDFLTNQQFRRDYWVRGARSLSMLERVEAIRAQRVVMVTPLSEVTMKVAGVLGDADLQESLYQPVLRFLSDHRVHTIAQIEDATPKLQGGFASLMQIILVLVGKNVLQPSQDKATVDAVAERVLKLNRRLCRHARSQPASLALASAVTGGGILLSRIEQLFLLAREQGAGESLAWAQQVFATLREQGQNLIKDGKPITDEQAQIDELIAQAHAFREHKLPLLKALRVC